MDEKKVKSLFSLEMKNRQVYLIVHCTTKKLFFFVQNKLKNNNSQSLVRSLTRSQHKNKHILI